jgi:hypothetical protein
MCIALHTIYDCSTKIVFLSLHLSNGDKYYVSGSDPDANLTEDERLERRAVCCAFF